MSFLALVILGCVTYRTLPVSLLPDVDIPHITVLIEGEGRSARELEASVTEPLRRSLLQVGGIEDIVSETRDASAVIRITMDYGIDTDKAFIEVNEKIDGAMSSLPRDIPRPRVIKATATEIPAVYLYATPAPGYSFADVAEVVTNVVRRRLEQLPQVAMVDMSGTSGKIMEIRPDADVLAVSGIGINDIEAALAAANTAQQSMTVRDGVFEYNVSLANTLRTADDIRKLHISSNGRLFALGDICTVELKEKEPSGIITYGGERAVGMAVVKHPASTMDDMEQAIADAIASLDESTPGVRIASTRSQTQLLDFTISNLKQNLILGLILVFLVCALFMRSIRLPFVVGITVIVAVIVTFLLFFIFGVSINIISMAGLILAVGMMIDNSVIVAENITQFRQRGLTLALSCERGTNEMITPMLSSSLTTVAVFVPLVYMSGIAGAVFADQAFAITAGLAASYAVGITLMPVLYYLFFRRRTALYNPALGQDSALQRCYDRAIDFVFSHKVLSLGLVVLTVLALWPLSKMLETARLPETDATETLLHIDWNSGVTVAENNRRTEALIATVGDLVEEYATATGAQDYVLDDSRAQTSAETEIYLRTSSTENLDALCSALSAELLRSHPGAVFSFSAPDNIFEKVFSSSEPPLVAQIRTPGGASADVSRIDAIREKVESATGRKIQGIPLSDKVDLVPDPYRLALYGVPGSEVQRTIAAALHGSEIGVLRSAQDYIPVQINNTTRSLDELLAAGFVKSSRLTGGSAAPSQVPLRELVHKRQSSDFKGITADGAGVFTPFAFDISASEADELMQQVRAATAGDAGIDLTFTGSIFSGNAMMRELMLVLGVSLLMMYFILSAQFGSFMQPLIVLLEIPIDISFALLSLLLFGQTLNLMSAIGIIVTCGIVVNDSILKLDAINELRRDGMPLLEAVHTAGRRRLKPILMTSLTTILAMVPVLFTSDLGSELQRPLAIAMIGSMIVGTLVSVTVIPLVYYLLSRKKAHAAPTL